MGFGSCCRILSSNKLNGTVDLGQTSGSGLQLVDLRTNIITGIQNEPKDNTTTLMWVKVRLPFLHSCSYLISKVAVLKADREPGLQLPNLRPELLQGVRWRANVLHGQWVHQSVSLWGGKQTSLVQMQSTLRGDSDIQRSPFPRSEECDEIPEAWEGLAG